MEIKQKHLLYVLIALILILGSIIVYFLLYQPYIQGVYESGIRDGITYTLSEIMGQINQSGEITISIQDKAITLIEK